MKINSDEKKVAIIKKILEDNPKGIALIDIRTQTQISYPTIKKIVLELGYKIVKRDVIRVRPISIAIRGD